MQYKKGEGMNTSTSKPVISKQRKPNIFAVLKPYSRMVTFLIVMALLSSGINMLIPKIIGRSIDAFSAKHYVLETVVIEFMLAAITIFIFTYLQNIIQT